MKKILVPVDLGDKPANQIRYAIGFSQQFKCKLIFFYADMSLIPTSYTKEVYNTSVDTIIRVKTQLLCNLVERSRKKFQIKPALLHYECRVQTGSNTKDDILKLATQERVSMILMSTHGRSGLRKFFFGSVASAVINNAKVPVITIPLIYKFREVKKLVYASDLHNLAEELEAVKTINRSLKAKISVINLNYGFNNPEDDMLQLIKAEDAAYKEFMRRIEYSMADDIKLYMKNQPKSILILFRHHKTGIEKLLIGNITEHFPEGLKFPLLTFSK